MSKFLTAVMLVLGTSTAFAMTGETHPIPLKERLKWQMWEQGIPEFKQPLVVHLDPKMEDLQHTLNKLKL